MKKPSTSCAVQQFKLQQVAVSLYNAGRHNCENNSVFTSVSLILKLKKLQKMCFSVPRFSVYSRLSSPFFPSQKYLLDRLLP